MLKISVTTKMYFFPFEEVGKDPIISQDIFSNGRVALIVPSGTCGLGYGHYIADIAGILVSISQYPACIPASRNALLNSQLFSVN